MRGAKIIEENPKQLALAFAVAVTVHSPSYRHWVARNGEESLFRTLHQILPEVRRSLQQITL
jgi:hypothetical protein